MCVVRYSFKSSPFAAKTHASTEITGRHTRQAAKKSGAFSVRPPIFGLPGDYPELLGTIKARIQHERLAAVITANSAMVLLYWDIGRMILERQHACGWGAKIIDRLAGDLRDAYPDMKGLSSRNLKYMRAFCAAWPDRAIVQAPLAQITWYHNIALLEKVFSKADVIVELKAVPFNPGFIGQMNFYLSAADDLLRHADDKPSVGLLLCRSKDKVVVEYALRNLKRPLGVAEWETTIVEKLPGDLRASLPTVEEIEAELDSLRGKSG